MEKEFWDDRWKTNEIAFHLEDVNPILLDHFEKLSLKSGRRVFIPLCGKTKDINWLLKNNYKVVGIELNEIAVEELFLQLKIKPNITKVNNLTLCSFNNLEIYLGNFFDLSENILGYIDAIYDRAALVALPFSMRENYSKHIVKITNNAPQLLITYNYDQSLLDGPPFAVLTDEIKKLYKDNYKISKIDEIEIPGGLKKKCKASEEVWLLSS